jgi:opacity protein-like surface antigen
MKKNFLTIAGVLAIIGNAHANPYVKGNINFSTLTDYTVLSRSSISEEEFRDSMTGDSAFGFKIGAGVRVAPNVRLQLELGSTTLESVAEEASFSIDDNIKSLNVSVLYDFDIKDYKLKPYVGFGVNYSLVNSEIKETEYNLSFEDKDSSLGYELKAGFLAPLQEGLYFNLETSCQKVNGINQQIEYNGISVFLERDLTVYSFGVGLKKDF